MKIDALDFQIIKELLNDSKQSVKHIARKLRVPISTVYSRIKRMEQKKILSAYSVKVDWKKIGYGICAYVLVFVDTTKLKELNKTQEDIKKKMQKIEGIEQVDIITGEADMLLRLRAKNTEDLGKMLRQKIQQIKGVVKTKTMVCI